MLNLPEIISKVAVTQEYWCGCCNIVKESALLIYCTGTYKIGGFLEEEYLLPYTRKSLKKNNTSFSYPAKR